MLRLYRYWLDSANEEGDNRIKTAGINYFERAKNWNDQIRSRDKGKGGNRRNQLGHRTGKN